MRTTCPCTTERPFKLYLRLYGPKKEVTDGTWAPPAVQRLVQAIHRALLGPRSHEPSHFSNSFPKAFWAHFGTELASFMSSPT